jgi:hypothetical protein
VTLPLTVLDFAVSTTCTPEIDSPGLKLIPLSVTSWLLKKTAFSVYPGGVLIVLRSTGPFIARISNVQSSLSVSRFPGPKKKPGLAPGSLGVT